MLLPRYLRFLVSALLLLLLLSRGRRELPLLLRELRWLRRLLLLPLLRLLRLLLLPLVQRGIQVVVAGAPGHRVGCRPRARFVDG